MTKKILLIGGSGYLGQIVAKEITKINEYVLTIADIVEPINFKSRFVEVDILNRIVVDEIIKHHDLVINFTGQITNPMNNCFLTNTIGIDNIINAVDSYNKKLFHISTVSIYGTTPYADENTPWNPESPYAACKAFAEYRLKMLSENSLCILRLPNLYGRNQPNGLFAYLLKSYQTDSKLKFNNSGNLSRYFLHVSDCADAILRSVNKNLFGTFNIPSNDKYNLTEIIELVETMNNITFEKKFSKIKSIENIGEIDFRAFQDATEFIPIHSLTEFIKKTFNENE